ncbi:hypothetical protein ACF3DV_17580 [Chlorogloeopsis fritschii PCC 9212]|jgi:glycosyltransferase involved in cell wall biosynthesis|uniref:Co-chaperone DjlA N-terminal domain-containing protein n=1 Tax=Chlorogloeopsis fritschii PCC 6912 TaxID=211165 RepID=A0A3S0Y1F7_CHLFR|nr:hypothetical protein [Chlorogloeopsis fritschii]MBF2005878.1 hypothetical protein [Chlorogloeopsis fritschii C42_A2020_084]RUR74247.1 hypothetical protein PCC6912_53480 [Chlorogloeopsis fritschii PCC 6912]
MAKYDKIFKSEGTLKEPISSEEAVAAIAVVTAVADSSLEEADVEFIADSLWELEVFEDSSDDELIEMVDKLLSLAEKEGVGALFNTARQSLSQEMLLDAFASSVILLVDEDELRIPKGKKNLLKEIQKGLEINDEEAQEIIDEVLSSFEDLEEEEET